MLIYDYSKLRGRILEICGTVLEFSKQIGLSQRSISLKLNNKLYFKQNEIQKAVEILKIKDEDINLYFFTRKVQNN